MAMTVRPLDSDLVDRMIELADLPWSLEAYEDAFVRNGWHATGEDGEAVIGWYEPWPIAGEEGVDDWWLVLGEWPGCRDGREVVCEHAECRTDCSVLMPFAYFADPDDPEEWEREQGPFLGRPDCRPDAPREDFQAEYERAARLLRERLGEPLPEGIVKPDDADQCLVWERGGSWVILLMGTEWISYGAYDQVAIEVRPKI